MVGQRIGPAGAQAPPRRFCSTEGVVVRVGRAAEAVERDDAGERGGAPTPDDLNRLRRVGGALVGRLRFDQNERRRRQRGIDDANHPVLPVGRFARGCWQGWPSRQGCRSARTPCAGSAGSPWPARPARPRGSSARRHSASRLSMYPVIDGTPRPSMMATMAMATSISVMVNPRDGGRTVSTIRPASAPSNWARASSRQARSSSRAVELVDREREAVHARAGIAGGDDACRYWPPGRRR